MRVFLDTSVVVAALLPSDARHGSARGWFERSGTNGIELIIGMHTLAETFSALTGMPLRPRPSSAAVATAIREAGRHCTIVELTAGDYLEVLAELAATGLRGGVIYDALLARTARKAGADLLLTFNMKDFLRVWPDAGTRLQLP